MCRPIKVVELRIQREQHRIGAYTHIKLRGETLKELGAADAVKECRFAHDDAFTKTRSRKLGVFPIGKDVGQITRHRVGELGAALFKKARHTLVCVGAAATQLNAT